MRNVLAGGYGAGSAVVGAGDCVRIIFTVTLLRPDELGLRIFLTLDEAAGAV